MDCRLERDRVDVVRTGGGRGERFVEQSPLLQFDDAQWQELGELLSGHRTRLLLAPPQVHFVSLQLPKVARSYLRTAIPLQLMEHAPLPVDRLEWAMGAIRTQGDSLSLRVAMAQTETLDLIEEGFKDHGIPLPPIVAESGTGETIAIRKRSGAPVFSRPWIWATMIVALSPLLLVVALHLLVLHERHRVDALDELARPRLMAERRQRALADSARGLNRVFDAPPVTSVIENLADQLPSTSHAIDVSSGEDGAIGFTIATSDPVALRRALAGDGWFAAMHEIDATKTPDGSAHMRFRAQAR